MTEEQFPTSSEMLKMKIMSKLHNVLIFLHVGAACLKAND